MADQGRYIGFVGTTSMDGSRGIYQIALDPQSRTMEILATRSMYNSGYLTLSGDGRNLYVLSEGMTFRGKASGGVTAYRVDGGRFEELNADVTDGQRPCFVFCDDEAGEIYIGNFYNGTIPIYPRLADGSLGPRKAYLRHEQLGPPWAGIHCVAKSPAGRYLAALELSGDLLYVYDCQTDYRIIGSYAFPEGAGPRHLAFGPDGRTIYVNRQMDEMVSVLAFDPASDPKVRLLQELSVRSADMGGKTEPAAIKVCPGKPLLAVSNRGIGAKYRADSITLFGIEGESGLLRQLQVLKTGGEMPRDFAFTRDGRYLVAGYQSQGYLDVFRVEDDHLTYAFRGAEIPCPVCIAF